MSVLPGCVVGLNVSEQEPSSRRRRLTEGQSSAAEDDDEFSDIQEFQMHEQTALSRRYSLDLDVAAAEKKKRFAWKTADTHPSVDTDFSPTPMRLSRVFVGGLKFVLPTSELLRAPSQMRLTKVAAAKDANEKAALCDRYDVAVGHYHYFRRNVSAFQVSLEYMFTGELHVPQSMCREQFVTELTYWGVPIEDINRCCLCKLNATQQKRVLCATSASPTSFTANHEPDKGMSVASDHAGTLREHAWELLDDPQSSIWARVFAYYSMLVVVLSIGTLILGSMKEFQIAQEVVRTTSGELERSPNALLSLIEEMCIVWFTAEYLARLLAAPKRCQFIRAPINCIDLIAILPFYVELGLSFCGITNDRCFESQMAFLAVRVLRILRIARLFKIARYSKTVQGLIVTLQRCLSQFMAMAGMFGIMIIVFSTLIYFAERDEPGTNFVSIPAAFWWSLVTMTTVGYGDVVPETTIGKIIGSVAILFGVIIMALPITLIVQNYGDIMKEMNRKGRQQSNSRSPTVDAEAADS